MTVRVALRSSGDDYTPDPVIVFEITPAFIRTLRNIRAAYLTANNVYEGGDVAYLEVWFYDFIACEASDFVDELEELELELDFEGLTHLPEEFPIHEVRTVNTQASRLSFDGDDFRVLLYEKHTAIEMSTSRFRIEDLVPLLINGEHDG